MRGARLSILGLYLLDNSIFEKLQLPESLDREAVINNIIIDNSELEVLYPDPDFMKDAIGFWSIGQQWSWKHLADLAEAEYNPIWNKDGLITEKETRDITNTGKINDQQDTTTIDARTGYNSTAWADSNKSTTDNKLESNAKNVEAGTITHERRETGNIGVTTTQAMAREEIELAKMFNVYNEISKSFKKRFCLMVY